ncbi:hypothetical protein V6N11_067540 [Hibiscus sabdariffa]|uniref:Amidase domain-containing protein n=1 Tax=Hibiscus sabdariffa TaxID=183260 RepID=A0ABR2SR23_9ROSI
MRTNEESNDINDLFRTLLEDDSTKVFLKLPRDRVQNFEECDDLTNGLLNPSPVQDARLNSLMENEKIGHRFLGMDYGHQTCQLKQLESTIECIDERGGIVVESIKMNQLVNRITSLDIKNNITSILPHGEEGACMVMIHQDKIMLITSVLVDIDDPYGFRLLIMENQNDLGNFKFINTSLQFTVGYEFNKELDPASMRNTKFWDLWFPFPIQVMSLKQPSEDGSSNGYVVRVSSRLCHVDLGVDIGGFVRMLASLGGVVGFKPIFGCISHSKIGWDVQVALRVCGASHEKEYLKAQQMRPFVARTTVTGVLPVSVRVEPCRHHSLADENLQIWCLNLAPPP